MKPRGPLMIEHRLIEKMFYLAEKEVDMMMRNSEVDPVFIDTMVDFVRTYADRTHHGKEEDILFRDLEKKEMNDEDTVMMQELVDEHVYARNVTGDLVNAKDRYLDGDQEALPVIIEKLNTLIKFYPEHIRKEDKVFFPNTETYFSKDELDSMLDEFWEFDKNMIHEKYQKLIDTLSSRYE